MFEISDRSDFAPLSDRSVPAIQPLQKSVNAENRQVDMVPDNSNSFESHLAKGHLPG